MWVALDVVAALVLGGPYRACVLTDRPSYP